MFDWLGDIFSGIGNAIGDTIEYLGTQIANTIFDAILQWFYEIIYGAVADFFTMMVEAGGGVREALPCDQSEASVLELPLCRRGSRHPSGVVRLQEQGARRARRRTLARLRH